MAELRSAACTIVSPNYLAYARTLAASYLEQHPGHRFFVLMVAALSDATLFAGERFETVMLPEIGLGDLRGEAMKYDILELNTNVKPSLMLYLLERRGVDRLLYLDPDIFVYAPLAPVFEALGTHDGVLTPHITAPIEDDKLPNEQEKWMNLLPGLFAGVAILRDAGCNMAYWNLHERTLVESANGLLANRVPLRFFHFSGIVPADAESLSKHTDRFTLASRPDLQAIFAAYKAAVLGNKDAALEALPYGFDTFSDGTAVTRLSRRLYAKHKQHFPASDQIDPFDANGPWLAFCRREKLVAGKAAPAKATWKEFSGTDRRVEMVHRLLRLALRVLGPNRYELLMRYVAHISVLRNQSVFLNRRLGG